MAADLALDKAELVSMFLQSLLYGAFLVLYFGTIYVLVYRRTTDKVNIPLLAAASAMFVLSTVHISLDLSRLIEAFITYGREPQVTGGAVAYYSQINNWKHVLKSAVYLVQTLIGDSFVTYRTYIVWGRRSVVIIVPALLVLGTVVITVGLSNAIASAPTGSTIFSSGINPWIKALFAVTLTTNILCTSLIAYRITSINRSVAKYAGGTVQDLAPVVIIIVESGAMYSFSALAMLIVYELGSNAQYIVLDATFPIIGITFALIIVRIGLNLTQDGSSPKGGSRGQNSKPKPSVPTFSSATSTYQMRPLAVNVTRTVQEHADAGPKHMHSDQDSLEKIEAFSPDQSSPHTMWAK